MEPDNPQPQSPAPFTGSEAPQSPGVNTPPNVYPAPSTTPQQSTLPPVTKTGMFNGRLNRIGFLISFIYIGVYFLIPFGLQVLLRGHAITNIVSILFGIIGAVLVIPVSISVGIRRWHDLDQSGFLVLLGLIPFVGTLVFIVYLFIPGTQGTNKYGEPDSRPPGFMKVLFGKV